MDAGSTNRYRSRVLREMKANRANPFNSPPSSTGSHGTVSPTQSFFEEGDFTKALNEEIDRAYGKDGFPINWEAAHQKWPEYFKKPNPEDIHPYFRNQAKAQAQAKAREQEASTSKNTDAKHIQDESTGETWQGSTRLRAEMQPSVEDASETSSIRGNSPVQGRAYYKPKQQLKQSPLSKTYTTATQQQRKSPVQEALERLSRGPISPQATDQKMQNRSPQMSSAKSSMTAVPPSPQSMASPRHNTSSAAHVKSFFMPDVSHLGDFVTGTLRFSGAMKNGVPIFVKHGKVHDRQDQNTPASHAAVDGLQVPEDEEKIFVSMDMIRQEIVSLQDSHDKVQNYAEEQRQRANALETQLNNHGYSTQPNDKILAQKTQLELDVAALQTRLQEASKKLSTNEIATESLAHERDRAVNKLQDACDDISNLTRKLSVREKELSTSQRQLESTQELRQDNNTLRRDIITLRNDSENVRKENKRLQNEIQTLVANRNGRAADKALVEENKSLRHLNKTFLFENKDLQENVDGLQHEIEAVRQEQETLREQFEHLKEDKSILEQDNVGLVRQNEKYYSDYKNLRRDHTNLERNVRELREENENMKKALSELKHQLQNAPSNLKDQESVQLGEPTENMTSAYFLPDITVKTTESRYTDASETKDVADMESTAHTHNTNNTNTNNSEQFARNLSNSHLRNSKSVTTHNQNHKVAFAMPTKSALKNNGSSGNVANQGSKRRNAEYQRESRQSWTGMDITDEIDNTTGMQSGDYFAIQEPAIPIDVSIKDPQGTRQTKDSAALSRASYASCNSHRSNGTSQKHTVEYDTSRNTQRSNGTIQKHTVEYESTLNGSKKASTSAECPALSPNARNILDGLCPHNCSNCIVCSRISSHRGVVSSVDLEVGKKRVTIPRPVPVTDREIDEEDQTMRPSQSPGHALAMVIKGLEDESEHMQMEISELQAQYNSRDKGRARRDRMALAASIRTLLKKLEVKNDQIYSLYDVLEGQKAAGQAMTEEDVEMTVLNITGMTVRDVTKGFTDKITWDQDE